MNVIIWLRCSSELQTEAIKYGSCLILKILRFQKQESCRVELRNVFNTLFIPCSKKLRNKFLRKTAIKQLLFMNSYDNSVVKNDSF